MVDDNECNAGEPIHFGIRLFVSKDQMLAKHKENPEAVDAIMRAPRSNNGFYFGNDIDYTNVIVRTLSYCAKPGPVSAASSMAVTSCPLAITASLTKSTIDRDRPLPV
jgi:hypothetical protein